MQKLCQFQAHPFPSFIRLTPRLTCGGFFIAKIQPLCYYNIMPQFLRQTTASRAYANLMPKLWHSSCICKNDANKQNLLWHSFCNCKFHAKNVYARIMPNPMPWLCPESLAQCFNCIMERQALSSK